MSGCFHNFLRHPKNFCPQGWIEGKKREEIMGIYNIRIRERRAMRTEKKHKRADRRRESGAN